MNTMNVDLKQTFARIKPVCDIVMMCPNADSIAQFTSRVGELKKEAVQELQQYLLFPFITHIKSTEIEKKYELQWRIIDAIRVVLEKVTVMSFEMCIKIETGLLSLVFDNSKPGMIADVPEELKHSVMKCLTVLMLHIDDRVRNKMLRTQVPLIAQAVFVSVHLAKLERLRALRLAAIDSVTAHTACHRQLTDAYHIKDIPLETLVVDMLASILPGVLAALQDVATCPDNPGHAVQVAAIDAIHRILCLTMNDKYLLKHSTITAEDFAKMVIDKRKPNKEVSSKEKNPKEISKRSAEWFAMAGEKLVLISKSLSELITDDHPKVRRELGVYCARLLTECHQTMQPSVSIALDLLLALSGDSHPEVSEYCSSAVRAHCGRHVADSLRDKFASAVTGLPRVLNNVDSARKLTALNMLYGYIEVMMDSAQPQTLTAALSTEHSLQSLVSALLEAAALHTDLVLLARHTRDEPTTAPTSSPWLKLRHLDGAAVARLWSIARLLGGAECASLLLDRLSPHSAESAALANTLASGGAECASLLLDRLSPHSAESAALANTLALARLLGGAECASLLLDRLSPHSAESAALANTLASGRPWSLARLLGGAECASLLLDRLSPHSAESAALANTLASAPNAPAELAQRVLSAYTEESVWYLPLEVGSEEPPSTDETLDPSVYDPRAWTKDSVPGLYEGATETRYTGISYLAPRSPRRAGAGACACACATRAEAQRNMALACILTEGVGLMARRLMADFQPYLLKTLCLILERVGSRYEMLHLAGVKAINDIATACGRDSVPDLIRCNADYFTHQISVRLKKAWNTESALQILSVVMQYSDASILDCLYGIVEDVLVQSLDKYHEKNLQAYLQVFLTFITCIRKWFPAEDESKTTEKKKSEKEQEIDVLKDLMEYLAHTKEMDKLMNNEEAETTQSAEEMYKEDQKMREEGILDYDDKVTEETPPLPRHIVVTQTILKRCLNFLTSKNTEVAILALQILKSGFPILVSWPDSLLPLAHSCWAPLAARCAGAEDAVVLRQALELLVTMAALAKDFLRQRAATDVLPHIYVFLHKSARESHLKDAGAAYRSSAAFRLQASALNALRTLASDLVLEAERLEDAMACVDDYLSSKQPRPLQVLSHIVTASLQASYVLWRQTWCRRPSAWRTPWRVSTTTSAASSPGLCRYWRATYSGVKPGAGGRAPGGRHGVCRRLPQQQAAQASAGTESYSDRLIAGELRTLASNLVQEAERLEDAMACVDDYLSSKQPRPLQELAVKFFIAMLEYDYGASWYHLRALAGNECVLHPPDSKAIDLVPIIGTPYSPTNKDFERNLALVFAGQHRHG
ncbi:TELO2-interacting protein 1 homolog [Cydia strobilella]|uniref:TELO2-interacting protein 1 homolog n=1 Tax=Cydia strobilella TaxID=1100964 RepID=UPI0030044D66